MNLQTQQLKKAMLLALEQSLGIVTAAAKSVGIDRTTHYLWLKDDEEYKAAVDSIQDITLDFAESQLHKQIKDGEVTSTIFYLKTKGKKRGYVERVEQDVSINLPQVTIEIVN
jgi:hypothetical protein